jgi:4-amino-4-deoxy-L-arabinose transferase-like glycosyltransferase
MRERGEGGFAWPLAAIVVLGAVVRIVFVLSQQQHVPLMGDAYVYTAGAKALASGRGWIDPYGGVLSIPTASHPPLYMVWLWIPAFFANAHEVSQLANMLWSCIPGTATVLLCGLAGREIAGRRTGLIAAGLAAVYPGVWVYDGLLLSETTAIFTAAGVLLFAYRYKNRPTLARAVWLGVWCGLATLARSELALTFLLVLLPLVVLTKGRDWKQRIGWLAVAGIVGWLVVSPWLAFNVGRFHQTVFLSTSAGRTMAAANCPATYKGPLLGFKSYPCLNDATKPYAGKRYDDSDRDKLLRGDSYQFMKDHWGQLPWVVAARWGRILEVYQPRQEIRLNGYYHVQGRVGTELQFWSFYPVALLAIAGAFVLRRRRILLFPLLAFPVMTLISVATTFAQWRYRAATEPALVLLAAVAIAAGYEHFSNRRRAEVEPAPATAGGRQVVAAGQ